MSPKVFGLHWARRALELGLYTAKKPTKCRFLQCCFYATYSKRHASFAGKATPLLHASSRELAQPRPIRPHRLRVDWTNPLLRTGWRAGLARCSSWELLSRGPRNAGEASRGPKKNARHAQEHSGRIDYKASEATGFSYMGMM